MTRIFSYNWLKEYVKTKASAKEFAKELSLKSMTVERVEKVEPKFSGVITARILEVKKYPNADKLRLVIIETGKGRLTLVCAASNIAAGQMVPFSPVGAKLQNPAGGGMMKVKEAEIRGVKSPGMLCSPKELGLGEDHSGIMILPLGTKIGVLLERVLESTEARPRAAARGRASGARAPDAIDYLLEVEITSNRPDVMSVVGLAREAAAVLGEKFSFPPPKPNLKVKKEIPLKIKVLDKKLCPRYQAVVITGIKVGPAPLWLQQRLMNAGLRPINNLADITNYVMLESGQPMHVFDYDKLNGGEIIVRPAKAGEKILALDGKTYKLNPQNLVIADAKKPVAIAGVMGGEESAATAFTKTIVFESANFNTVSVRKTSRALNLHSDSSDLFEKNLNIESPKAALLRAVDLTQKLAGGGAASKIIDLAAKNFKPRVIKFNPASVGRYLGIAIPNAKIKNILQSLSFQTSGNKILKVIVPWWRTEDISQEYDLIEEIARIYGYHNLPTELPAGEIPQAPANKQYAWEDKIKDVLTGLGFSEIYSYSLIAEDLIKKIKFNPANCLKLINPLNQELEYLRPTLIAGILKVIADNQKNYPQQQIFELSNVYLKKSEKSLPDEEPMLGGAIGGGKNLFYQAKGVVEFIFKKLQITNYRLQITDSRCPLWQAGQAVDIYSGRIFLGQFGIISRKISEKFDIVGPVAVFDLRFWELIGVAKNIKTYQPIPEFPEVKRDLAIIFDRIISWGEVVAEVKVIDPLIQNVEYLSAYIGENISVGKKSLAFSITFRSPARTLRSEEVDKIMEKILVRLRDKFKAEQR